LQHNTFNIWLETEFQPTVAKYIEAIMEWIKKGCEFFDKEYREELVITFPETPQIDNNNSSDRAQENGKDNRTASSDVTSVAIPVGLGWLLGGAVGAVVLGGASYILNTLSTSETATESINNDDFLTSEVTQIYLNAAQNYLTNFSQQAFATLQNYETNTENLVSFIPIQAKSNVTQTEYKLQLLDNLMNALQEDFI
jgi:hypothetical protein